MRSWNSISLRLARFWVTTRLRKANSGIRQLRRTRPSLFGTAIVAAIVGVIFLSGAGAWVWAAYRSDREDIIPIATFVGAIVLAYAALKQASTASRRHYAQTEADRKRRITDSFTKAVEQLGSDKLEVRVGSIFALEMLSYESPLEHWTIMEVLAAFVRERMQYTAITARLSERAYFLWLQAGRPEGRSEEFWVEAVRLERLEEPQTDIAAILNVMRRSWDFWEREGHGAPLLDLSGAYLRKAELGGIPLKRSDLQAAHLEEAWLFGAHLEEASLWHAHLERADLQGAHLEGANLNHAHLEGANLTRAHVKRASLARAYMEGADLTGAHLEGAELLTAVGLTDRQLIVAFGDGKTLLPRRIKRPESWPPLDL
jgi:hypothetical protein